MNSGTGKRGGQQATPYQLDPSFERALVFLACTDGRFMGRTAHEVRPELLSLAECRVALESAQTFYREMGYAAESPSTTIQMAARKRDEGKLTHEEVCAVAGFFDVFDGEKPPRVEEVEPIIVGVLRERFKFAIAEAAVAAVREKSGSAEEEMFRLTARVEKLGKVDDGIGLALTSHVIAQEFQRLRNQKLQPFGISALDDAFEGGVPKGTLTCFLGGPGGGKSMVLSHSAGQLSAQGYFCLYATLELPRPRVLTRILANITGIPIRDLLAERDGCLERALDILQIAGGYPVYVQDFPAHVTTVETIRSWVESVEVTAKRKVDVLFVDYADKLTASGRINEKGMYEEMRIVYEKLRLYCAGRDITGVTASQSRAREERGKKHGKRTLDLEHTADSMHKGRVVDQFVTINVDDETLLVEFFLAKNRYGEGRKLVAPTPTAFALGQVAPVTRDYLPVKFRPVITAARGSTNGAVHQQGLAL